MAAKVVALMVLSILVGFLSGYFVGLFEMHYKVVKLQQTASRPPTDTELVEFWFGNRDKAALRKRICQ